VSGSALSRTRDRAIARRNRRGCANSSPRPRLRGRLGRGGERVRRGNRIWLGAIELMFRHDALIRFGRAFDPVLKHVAQRRHLRADHVDAACLQIMSGMGGQSNGIAHKVEVTAHIRSRCNFGMDGGHSTGRSVKLFPPGIRRPASGPRAVPFEGGRCDRSGFDELANERGRRQGAPTGMGINHGNELHGRANSTEGRRAGRPQNIIAHPDRILRIEKSLYGITGQMNTK
jgi:hypothetical protein